MASTKLIDTIHVEPFNDILAENDPTVTNFAQAGVAVRDPLIDMLAEGPSDEFLMPFWRDLDNNVEENYSTDSDSASTPQKLTQGKMRSRKNNVNQSWSAKDLARELATQDAMIRIANRVSNYWNQRFQRRLIATTTGLYLANVAGNITTGFGTAGDMVHSVAASWSVDAFIEAAMTMGDHWNDLSAVAVNSIILTRILKEDQNVEDVRDSEGNLLYQTYKGKRLIVDDSLPVISGSPDTYVSVLYGSSFFGYGEGTPNEMTEIDRKPEQGNGGGEEILYSRKTWVIHPYGHTNLSDTNSGPAVSGGGYTAQQTAADLSLAANWERTHHRKNVPVAFLVTQA